MNFLDEKFKLFQQKSIEEKVACYSRNGRPFDMIMSQQMDRKFLYDIYELTNKLRHISKSKTGYLFLQQVLSHKRAMLYFNQPSSRTFLSFHNACHILGMKISEIRDPTLSSEVKGESDDDGLRTFSSYTDLIIMRHSKSHMAERAAWLLNNFSNRPVPIINGGSGQDQHPTQSLLDIYTLQRSFADLGGLDGKTLLMCGDLKRGRTVRSLSILMRNFHDVKVIYTAPKEFQMGDDVLDALQSYGVSYEIETESLRNVLGKADAIYMTRIQDEHDYAVGESRGVDISQFKLRVEDMTKVKATAAIMHPFPRRDEIDVEIDIDPRAKYWRQERNGMWTRAALICYIFGLDQEILNY